MMDATEAWSGEFPALAKAGQPGPQAQAGRFYERGSQEKIVPR